MQWISNNDPPIYIWDNDTWYNKKNKLTYAVDLNQLAFVSGELKILFTKKTKIMKKV